MSPLSASLCLDKHVAEALVTGPKTTGPPREEWWCVGGEVRGKGGGAKHHQPLKPPLPHPSPSRTRVNPCSARCSKPSVGQREGVFALRAGGQPRVAPAENTHTHSGNIHQKNTYSMAGRSNWLSDPAIGFLKQEETSSVSFGYIYLGSNETFACFTIQHIIYRECY